MSTKTQSGATEKQVGYALSLLDKAGYSTRYMDTRFKELGASMRMAGRNGEARDFQPHREAQVISP